VRCADPFGVYAAAVFAFNRRVPKERLKRSLRVTFLGMAVNSVLAGCKLIAGIAGHSHALVADAVESFSDLFSSLVVWRAMVVASEPADQDHPYGHGKAEPLAAAVVAAMLLAAAAGIAIQAVRGIANPHLVGPEPYTLYVLVGVVIIKESLFRFAHREGASLQSSAVRSDAWHHRSDAITSLFAGVGISVALIGGGGYESADDYAAMAASVVIAWNGWRLLRPALDELMDASPSLEVIDRIREAARTTAGVAEVEKCLVRKMGYHYYVDMHVEVDPEMSVRRAHAIAHEVKARVRQEQANVADVLVHVEPAGQKANGRAPTV
jgi:cation diffusion facilitator family transporter